MQRNMISTIAFCAMAGLAGPAFADCKEELAELRGQSQSQSDAGGEISKDGSLAPLESDNTGSAADAQGGPSETASGSDQSASADGENEIVKDGSQAPLEADVSSVATSGQDAEAQQEGTSDASEEAAENGMSQDAQEAIERAQAALQSGDEAGCMEAVDEARNL